MDSGPLNASLPSAGAGRISHGVFSTMLPWVSEPSTISSLGSATVFWSLFVGYAVLCRFLRFRREKALRRRLNYPDRASLARMTNDDAQEILRVLIQYEFPLFHKLALQFAIFKTYTFETMSKHIISTKNLADPKNSQKRYEDTTVIFSEFMLNMPNSERARKAIARMNFLHDPYKAAGQISNADFLYTLSVCVTEPIRFVKLYEWRQLNEMEVAAIGTFWKGLGESMDIQYKDYLKRDSWRDGIEFAEDITAWAKQYELEAMKPAKSNIPPAHRLMEMMIFHVPKTLKPFVEECLTVLMGDRVRDAFYYAEPGIFSTAVVYLALNLRRSFFRHLMLPRFRPLAYFSEPDPKTGRIQHFDYLVHPYYNPASFWARWGPLALATRLLGGTVPGPEKMLPEGFLITDIGPKGKVGKGADSMKAWEDRLRAERLGGCPYSH